MYLPTLIFGALQPEGTFFPPLLYYAAEALMIDHCKNEQQQQRSLKRVIQLIVFGKGVIYMERTRSSFLTLTSD